MKRIIALSLALVMLLLTACAKPQQPVGDTTPGTVATTTSTEPSGTEATTVPTEATEPTTVPTEAPTTAPTEEPTEAATEPASKPSTGNKEENTKPPKATEPPTEPTKATEPTKPTTGDSSSTGGKEEATEPTKPTETTKPPEKEAKLTLKKSSLTLEVGNTSTLGYEYTGSGTLTWKTSNSAVATVSNGKVTAKSAGTATITLTDGKLKAECKVTVNPAPTEPKPTEPPKPSVGEMTIKTAAGTTIHVGETLQIEYTYTGDKSALTWKSNDTSVLTVNNSGKVTGVGVGETRVAAYHGDTMVGRIRLVVEEKASKPVAKSISVSNITGPYFEGTSGVVGNYMTFTANAKTDGDRQAVTATSSNSGVASIELVSVGSSNKCKFKVKFKGAGSATITITSEDGNASKSYTVNVKSGYSSAKSGTLSPEEFVSCVNGIMKENGATISTSMGYRVLTLTDGELTGSKARSYAEGYVREFWPNGIRSMGLAYQGTDENGNHVFYIHC